MKSLKQLVGLSKPPKASQLSRRKRLLLIIGGSLVLTVIVAALIMMIFIGQINNSGQSIKPPDKIAASQFYSPLTGRLVASQAITERAVTAVMIDNSPEARPQSGLQTAGVVFEAVAEGGITRFMALYQEAEPSLIGPVRSLRPYFLEWANGFDAAVAHVGGSSQALTMIQSGNYGVDLDEFSNSTAYWRANDRYAPHNAYTDDAHLRQLEQTKAKTTSQFTAWPRADGQSTVTPSASQIDLTPSSGAFSVHYDYDSANNNYLRSLGSEPHRDRKQGQIAPNVVVALKMTSEDVVAIGSGQALIFQNGQVIDGSWRKVAVNQPLELLDQSGQAVSLNRGQVWLTALTAGKDVNWQ
jgi:hypothetical protein